MPDRTTERDEDCPECSCDTVHGCDCEDDGEVLSEGVERLEDGDEGRARTRKAERPEPGFEARDRPQSQVVAVAT